MEKPKEFLHSLNALRAIGAISVCLYHSSAAFGNFGAFPQGYLAVDLFFILSGFIAFYRFNSNAEIDLVKSAKKRFVRIYIVYIFATILGAIFLITKYLYRGFPLFDEGGYTPFILSFLRAFALNFFMLPDFDTQSLILDAPLYPFSLQNWTLFWEMVISLVFLFWRKAFWRFAAPLLIFFGLIVLTQMVGHGNFNHGFDNKGFWLGGLRACFGFLIGIICAKIFLSKQEKLIAFFKMCAPILLVLTISYFAWRGPISVWVEILFVALIFPILVIGISASKSAIYDNSVSRFFGRISYSIFGLHIVILSMMFFLYTYFGLFKLNLFSGIIYLGIVILSAAFFEKYIERRLNHFFMRQ